MFTDVINSIKKTFGVSSIKKTESEQAAELGYVIRYEDMTEFNITSILAQKLANLVCSDASVEIAADNADNRRLAFLNQSLQQCFADINIIAARTFGIGGVVLKPYVCNGRIYTDILPQNRFFVIEQHGEVITKAGFIAETLETANTANTANNAGTVNTAGKAKKFTRIEYHSLDPDGVYTIEHKVISGDKSIPLSDSPWRDIEPSVRISNVENMLFSVVKCPADNRKNLLCGEPRSVYGVPVTYGQDKIIKMILDLLNEIPDEYKNKKTFIGADSLLFDKNSKLPDSGLYRLFRGVGNIDNDSFWEVFSPEIRHTSYFEGVDYLFGLLEKAVCVNKGMLTDLDVSSATATAIKRSTLDTFSTVHAMRRNIEKAFDRLIYACGVITDAFDLCGDCGDCGNYGEYKARFYWDYRLLENTSETWKQYLEGYQAGAVSLDELRMYLFDEDRKTAGNNKNNNKNNNDGDNDGNMAVIRKVNEIIVENKEDECEKERICASKIFLPAGAFDSGGSFNPFRREAWNMTKQSALYKDNPDIAKYLAAEANIRI